MRDIDMERVNGTREKMLETVKSPVLTHEQKVAAMANLADSLLEVVDLPEGLHDLMDSNRTPNANLRSSQEGHGTAFVPGHDIIPGL